MAGLAKPPISNIGEETTIEIISSKTSYTPNFKTDLFDGSIAAPQNLGALFLYTSYTGCYVTFKVTTPCRIWAYTTAYSDGGGNVLNPVGLYKCDSDGTNPIYKKLSNIPSYNQWYLLFDRLEIGTYMIKSGVVENYCAWNEWYIETDNNPTRYITLNHLKMSMETVNKKIEETKETSNITVATDEEFQELLNSIFS